MSYVEHGSRIFLTKKFISNPLLRSEDYVVARKRSEGRLKLFNSCTDLRAWSPNVIDNCRYFREIIGKRLPSGRFVPYDVLIENLIIMGQTELASVRRQLEKYKSLRLTPEQQKQLRDSDYSSDVQIESSEFEPLKNARIVEDETGIPRRPGTPTQSICSSSSNYHDLGIDNESSFADNNWEGSQEVSASSSGTFGDTDRSIEAQSRDDEIAAERSRACGRSANQEVIIKKDSEIIALRHELAAKNAELEEIKEMCRNLESSLNEKAHMVDNLRKNLKTSRDQLLTTGDEMHAQVEEWKQKLYDSKCLMDHLKSTLAEKSQAAAAQAQEIQDLRTCALETETLRKERDCIRRKLDEMKNLLDERNDLLKLNREQAIKLEDQEDEINRLLGYIKQTLEQYNEEETKMKRELHELRSELETRNGAISQYETHEVTVRTEINSIGSLSKFQTSEIREMRTALYEDLEAVEEELSKRCGTYKNDHCRQERKGSKTKQTRTRTNDERTDYMECTIEQLTMQVSTTRVPSEHEQAAIIDAKIFSEFANSKEKIRRLVLKLEPYLEERSDLIDEARHLREALQDLQRDSKSRELKIQNQYSSEVSNRRRDREAYTKRIAYLENLLKEKMHRRERKETMDSEIDETLAIHVKRSIEKLSKLSFGLRGAGDEIAKIRDEAETREAEIAKLREQVQRHVSSRGQGDEADNHSAREIVRLKTEKERMREELKKQEESLRAAREHLLSKEFELKGLKRQKNDMSAQYKREVQKKKKHVDCLVREKEALVRENEGLHKTVLMINDLAMESDAMKIKLESLQEENSRLIRENGSMIKRCEDYENRLLDLAGREMRAKEAFERAQLKFQEDTLRNQVQMETLRNENEILSNESRGNKSKIKKLNEELRELKDNVKALNAMENVWSEMSRLNEDKEILDERAARLRYNLDNRHRVNEKLEDHLNLQISENEVLQNAIKQLRDNIERITKDEMCEDTAKNLLRNLPDRICEYLEKTKGKLNTGEFEVTGDRKEIKRNSTEDDALIGQLRDEIKLWKDKLSGYDEKMAMLERTNADLQEKLTKLHANNSSEEKVLAELEMRMRNKDMEIDKLTEDVEAKNGELKNLSERVESLVNENNEMSKELKNEKDLRQKQLKDMQQKHNARMKIFNDRHNDSMKKLLAQQEEFTKNTGNPFDSESWLRSLTMTEMAELHKRICASSPCEALISEASKTRALNDKQNQQLQQDEKLHTDMLQMKNGHHKDPDNIGLQYIYERRKFENTKNKSVEMALDENTFGTQRKNFLYQCAINHKYVNH